jgi:hypothetical protein
MLINLSWKILVNLVTFMFFVNSYMGHHIIKYHAYIFYALTSAFFLLFCVASIKIFKVKSAPFVFIIQSLFFVFLLFLFLFVLAY